MCLLAAVFTLAACSGHEASAEAARLDAIGGAADIEIDLGIASLMRQARGGGEFGGVGAAQLQRNGLLDGIEAQVTLRIAMDDCRAGDHFGEQQGMARQLAMEEPAMAIRPVHHGCYRKAAGQFEPGQWPCFAIIHGNGICLMLPVRFHLRPFERGGTTCQPRPKECHSYEERKEPAKMAPVPIWRRSPSSARGSGLVSG